MARASLAWPARIVVTAALLGLLAWLSDFPLGTPASHGVLRLAWRTVSQKVSLCRTPSAAELEKLPPHMRRPSVCQEQLLPYVLTVAVDGQPRLTRHVSSPGAHGNRPLFVQEDLPLAPGSHRVKIAFVPDDAVARSDQSGGDAWQSALRRALERSGRYEFDGEIAVAAGRVTLVQLQEQAAVYAISGP